jgi:hypothetical protein
LRADALPPPRHEKLADYRVLVIDANPLCPTAASVTEALSGLADRLTKLGCQVRRERSPHPKRLRFSKLPSPIRWSLWERSSSKSYGAEKRNSGSHVTRRWREMDSNPRSPVIGTMVFALASPSRTQEALQRLVDAGLA